jgi:hypothetical protein
MRRNYCVEELKTRPTSAGSRSAPATVDSKGRCAGVGRAAARKHGKYCGLRKIARDKGISYWLLQSRIRYGYTLQQALTMKKRARRPRPTRTELPAEDVQRALRSWGRR